MMMLGVPMLSAGVAAVEPDLERATTIPAAAAPATNAPISSHFPCPPCDAEKTPWPPAWGAPDEAQRSERRSNLSDIE